MKKIAFSVLLSSMITGHAFATTQIPCAAQIRENVAAVLRTSSEFKNEDPGGGPVGIYSIDLSQNSDGTVDVSVLYGTSREGSDGAAQADFIATADSSCQNINLAKSE